MSAAPTTITPADVPGLAAVTPTDVGSKMIALAIIGVSAALTPAYYAALAVRVITR